ncbi:hypothetical protein MKY34_01865 [Sporosarcina sp. FSL K6-1522]|uniref:AbrB/MazE/SpoVT family DNA-binding domain-containing protein n=1 Tax=Sporosarcina sp. FSL K6-1522 TaxID=2921554 RepID=UPI00315A89D3
MERNWKQSKTTIQIRQIVQIGDTYGITFTPEMLAHLNVSADENVQVVMTENDLVIRKVLPANYPDGDSDGFQDIVHEASATYGTTVKSE